MVSLKVRQWIAGDLGVLVLIACARVLLHVFTNGRYGFHRDELLTYSNALHLDWGYVVYPPMTALLARVELALFGTSLTGFRLFAALSQGLVMLITGLSARELGGKRLAQLVAALAVATSGHSLVSGWFMSYTSFDYLWWSLVAYAVIRLLKSDDPRWWLAIGSVIAFGLLTKYTMGFLALGVIGGVLFTPARRYLRSPRLWLGVALSLLLVAPNLRWQAQHSFVALDFLRTIHARDIGWGWTDYFLPNQLWKCANPVTIPLWGAGLWFLLAASAGKRYRMLGWMYIIPLVTLFLARGRDYYLAAAYPTLFAAGAVFGEQWLASVKTETAIAVRHTVWWSFASAFLLTASVTLPIAPLGSNWWRIANEINGGNFGYQLGWHELVQNVALVRDSLPTEDRRSMAILAQDDGETGAMALYGATYHLPPVISPMNSNWYRGYGNPPPDVVITVGTRRDLLESNFASCELATRLSNSNILVNHSIGMSEIFVCRHLRRPWPEFWRDLRTYG